MGLVCYTCNKEIDRAKWNVDLFPFCGLSCATRYRNTRDKEKTLRKALDNYAPEPNTGCWLWLGKTNGHQYGRINFKGRVENAHVVFYTVIKGNREYKKDLHHNMNVCSSKLCVNPDHMVWLSRHEHNILTHQIVDKKLKDKIIELYRVYKSLDKVAKELNLGKTTIFRYVKRHRKTEASIR